MGAAAVKSVATAAPVAASVAAQPELLPNNSDSDDGDDDIDFLLLLTFFALFLFPKAENSIYYSLFFTPLRSGIPCWN